MDVVGGNEVGDVQDEVNKDRTIRKSTGVYKP